MDYLEIVRVRADRKWDVGFSKGVRDFLEISSELEERFPLPKEWNSVLGLSISCWRRS